MGKNMVGEISEPRSTLEFSQPEHNLWRRIWRQPVITVARFTLQGYIRSGWILLDIIFLWFLYAFLFLEFGGNLSYFYGTVGIWLCIPAVLDTVIMIQRSFKTARAYLPLARISSRSSYIWGILLATVILRVVLFVLMLLLAASYHRNIPIIGIQQVTPLAFLVGAISLLLNCILLSALTIVLSLPIATRRIQIIFLACLVGMLYSKGIGPLANFLTFLQLPFAPFIATYQVGVSGVVDGYHAIMLIVTTGYIAICIWLASFWLKRRDLILY